MAKTGKNVNKGHQTFKTGAQKHTVGKLRFDLIPPEVDESLAAVYTLGTTKYSDRNWELGIPYMTCVASLRRHLNDWLKGNDINTIDGDLNSIEHVMFWAAALITFIKRNRKDLDDRPLTNKKS